MFQATQCKMTRMTRCINFTKRFKGRCYEECYFERQYYLSKFSLFSTQRCSIIHFQIFCREIKNSRCYSYTMFLIFSVRSSCIPISYFENRENLTGSWLANRQKLSNALGSNLTSMIVTSCLIGVKRGKEFR